MLRKEFGEFSAIFNEFQRGSGSLGKFGEFLRKKKLRPEISTLSLASEV